MPQLAKHIKYEWINGLKLIISKVRCLREKFKSQEAQFFEIYILYSQIYCSLIYFEKPIFKKLHPISWFSNFSSTNREPQRIKRAKFQTARFWEVFPEKFYFDNYYFSIFLTIFALVPHSPIYLYLSVPFLYLE